MVIDPALRMGLESGVTGRPPACPLSDLFGAGSVRSHLFRSCRLSGRMIQMIQRSLGGFCLTGPSTRRQRHVFKCHNTMLSGM